MDIASLVPPAVNPNVPELKPGDTVDVSAKVVESGRERIQVFQGVVIRVRGGADGGSFTVRRVASGVGVERTFMLGSPRLDKVVVLRRGKVRQARLYYMRGLSGKASRIRKTRS